MPGRSGSIARKEEEKKKKEERDGGRGSDSCLGGAGRRTHPMP